MAAAFVQQADGVVTGSGTTVATGTGGTNFGANLTAGNLKWFVIFYTAASAKTFTISDANNNNAAHVQVGNFYNASDQQGAVWGYVKNLAAGVGTTTATANAAVTFFCLYCAEYSGLDTVNPFQTTVAGGNRQASPGTGANLVTSGLMTPTAQPGIVLGLSNDFTSASNLPNAGTGFTSRTAVWLIGSLSTRPEDLRITSTAAVAATFTALGGTDVYYTVGAIFSEAGATSGTVQAPMMPQALPNALRRLGGVRVQPVTADAPVTTVLAPTEGAIVIGGNAASLTGQLSPTEGAIVFSGQTPALTRQLAPTEGSVVFGGQTPSLSKTLAPSEGSIVFGGNSPALTKQLAPSEGAIVFGGNTPSLTSQLVPTPGAIVINGVAPSISVGTILNPTEGTVVITGQAPNLALQLAPTEGAIVFGGNVPDLPGTVVVPVPFVIGGGWIPLKKKKKKKLKPVIELEHVVIIPQDTPDLDDKRIYRYFGELAPHLKNLRIQMVEAQDALEIAVRENKRIRDDEEFLILLSI